jgi:hypothetical protein
VSRRKIPKILIKPKNSRDTIIKSRVNKVTPIPRANRLSYDTNNSHGEFFIDSAHLMKDVIFVAYYTFNTPYEAEAVKLKASLKKLDLLHDVVAVPSIGDWQDNTRFKAKFLQQMLKKHRGRNIIYIDVDAIVHSIPILFKDYKCDIGIRFQDFRWRKNECLSGTIFLANNERVMKLCEEWEKINIKERDNRQNLEQWNLGSAITMLKSELKLSVINLPPEYTFIFDSMKVMYPGIKPVIEHFQASRQNKNS